MFGSYRPNGNTDSIGFEFQGLRQLERVYIFEYFQILFNPLLHFEFKCFHLHPLYPKF